MFNNVETGLLFFYLIAALLLVGVTLLLLPTFYHGPKEASA